MFDISKMIAQSCLKLFNKMIHHQKPKSIFNLYLGRNKRKTTKIIKTSYILKSKKLCNHFIYKVPKMYNKIPNSIKDTNFKIFERNVYQYLKEVDIWDICGVDSEEEDDI